MITLQRPLSETAVRVRTSTGKQLDQRFLHRYTSSVSAFRGYNWQNTSNRDGRAAFVKHREKERIIIARYSLPSNIISYHIDRK